MKKVSRYVVKDIKEIKLLTQSEHSGETLLWRRMARPMCWYHFTPFNWTTAVLRYSKWKQVITADFHPYDSLQSTSWKYNNSIV